MKKKLLSLALALALCLGLTVPSASALTNTAQAGTLGSGRGTALEVGTTEFERDEELWRFSNPVVGTAVGEYYNDATDETYDVLYNVFPKGTILTVTLPDGSIPQFADMENPHQLSELYIEHTSYGDDGLYYCANAEESDTTVTPSAPAVPSVTVEDIPASGTACPSTQTVAVDGQSVEFQMYALLDENGNPTNYIKLRDLASVLNGTAARFSIGYDGAISVTTGEAYAPVGTEMFTPFSGERSYTGGAQAVLVNGVSVSLTAITLTDDNGGGYNYFKLRDLGAVLGFNVGWDGGAFIETDKPYSGQ